MIRSSAVRWVAPLVLAGAVLGGSLAATSSAAVPDACDLTTTFSLAHAFKLSHAVEHKVVAEPPGNSAGVLRNRCRVFAWSGAKPTSSKLKREALVAGRLAWLNVNTWVTEQSPYAPVWKSHFEAELGAIRNASVELFLRRLHGRAFTPPRYGADEAIAYKGLTKRTVRLRALWWKRSDKSLLEMEVEEARGKPALAALKRIAGVIAERFNTECVYPCEGPAGG